MTTRAGIAVIGGTGLTSLETLDITRREVVYTPFGETSGPLTHGLLGDTEIVFLPRHGYAHTIPPHRVNYRANLWGLKSIGVTRVLAVTAVGGIRADTTPGKLAFPDQLIDYTYGREHTFFVDNLDHVTHVDFTQPYDTALRRHLIAAAKTGGLEFIPDGTYGATQGPRLETAAEIKRMARDGCTMVGMTGMPETALARELELEYTCCAVVSNWAAGQGSESIHAGIETHLKTGLAQVARLLEALMPLLQKDVDAGVWRS